MRPYLKEIRALLALLLVALVAGSSYIVAPKPAHAQVVTDIITEVETGLTTVYTDLTNVLSDSTYLKEYVLDPLAWAVAKSMLQDITNSTVNWINSGFQGSPAFVTNPEAFFENIDDNVAGQFIANNLKLNALCSPIALNVRLALAISRANLGNPYACSLSQIIDNVQGASIDGFEAGDFSQGGWPAFVSLAEPQNSFYGAYVQANADLNAEINNKTILNQNLLTQGNGFLSWQSCTPVTSSQNAVNNAVTSSNGLTSNSSSFNLNNNYSSVSSPLAVNLPPAPPGSAGTYMTDPGTGAGETCTTETPGTVIAGSINKALGSGQDTLVEAHELDEIIGALAAQLVNKVLGSGLTSVSQSSNGEASYLDQIQTQLNAEYASTTSQNAVTLSTDLSGPISYAGTQKSYEDSSLSLAIQASSSLATTMTACASDTPVLAEVQTLAGASTTPSVNAIGAEDTAISNQLTTLTNLSDSISAATTSSALSSLSQQYQSLVAGGTLPSPTTVQNAKSENGTVQSEVSTILSDDSTYANECKAASAAP